MAQLTSIFLVLCGPIFAHSLELEIDTAKSKVEFVAVGRPSMFKIRGEKGKVEGTLNFGKKESLGELRVDLNSFDTGIPLRNQHMKEKYLQTSIPANKNAILTVTKFQPSPDLLKSGGKAEIPFTGKLSLHGEQKAVDGVLVTEVQGGIFSGSTHLEVEISDFKIEIPSYLGIKVADKVHVEISIQGKISEKPASAKSK